MNNLNYIYILLILFLIDIVLGTQSTLNISNEIYFLLSIILCIIIGLVTLKTFLSYYYGNIKIYLPIIFFLYTILHIGLMFIFPGETLGNILSGKFYSKSSGDYVDCLVAKQMNITSIFFYIFLIIIFLILFSYVDKFSNFSINNYITKSTNNVKNMLWTLFNLFILNFYKAQFYLFLLIILIILGILSFNKPLGKSAFTLILAVDVIQNGTDVLYTDKYAKGCPLPEKPTEKPKPELPPA